MRSSTTSSCVTKRAQRGCFRDSTRRSRISPTSPFRGDRGKRPASVLVLLELLQLAFQILELLSRLGELALRGELLIIREVLRRRADEVLTNTGFRTVGLRRRRFGCGLAGGGGQRGWLAAEERLQRRFIGRRIGEAIL